MKQTIDIIAERKSMSPIHVFICVRKTDVVNFAVVG